MINKDGLPISCDGRDAWKVAQDVANSAGDILMRWWPETKVISDKGTNDIVTKLI
ncbi:MAG: hypothetical protein CM1200mP3_05090 [Chloroflexota bacterium]|nr:MAG: hypothetical protein CM1200mP3_05090 [Chloroflexota bacterium]